MKDAGRSQRDIAQTTGIPLVTLQRRLGGNSQFPITEFFAITDALDLDAVGIVAEAHADPDAA